MKDKFSQTHQGQLGGELGENKYKMQMNCVTDVKSEGYFWIEATQMKDKFSQTHQGQLGVELGENMYIMQMNCVINVKSEGYFWIEATQVKDKFSQTHQGQLGGELGEKYVHNANELCHQCQIWRVFLDWGDSSKEQTQSNLWASWVVNWKNRKYAFAGAIIIMLSSNNSRISYCFLVLYLLVSFAYSFWLNLFCTCVCKCVLPQKLTK